MKIQHLKAKEYYNLSFEEQDRFIGSITFSKGKKFFYMKCIPQETLTEHQTSLHRLNGPAVIGLDDYEEYWIDGYQVTKEAHELYIDFLKIKGLKYKDDE
jgi:hypothetical protein